MHRITHAAITCHAAGRQQPRHPGAQRGALQISGCAHLSVLPHSCCCHVPCDKSMTTAGDIPEAGVPTQASSSPHRHAPHGPCRSRSAAVLTFMSCPTRAVQQVGDNSLDIPDMPIQISSCPHMYILPHSCCCHTCHVTGRRQQPGHPRGQRADPDQQPRGQQEAGGAAPGPHPARKEGQAGQRRGGGVQRVLLHAGQPGHAGDVLQRQAPAVPGRPGLRLQGAAGTAHHGSGRAVGAAPHAAPAAQAAQSSAAPPIITTHLSCWLLSADVRRPSRGCCAARSASSWSCSARCCTPRSWRSRSRASAGATRPRPATRTTSSRSSAAGAAARREAAAAAGAGWGRAAWARRRAAATTCTTSGARPAAAGCRSAGRAARSSGRRRRRGRRSCARSWLGDGVHVGACQVESALLLVPASAGCAVFAALGFAIGCFPAPCCMCGHGRPAH
ncbi:hypothetical protein COO60DRAFT_679233 [Scenedesmus sp. NREL 46B-D3]|nr:hypothetical protein COO60DRAFT_679233 [Scenedesmus sp. NREL 46B-D3]